MKASLIRLAALGFIAFLIAAVIIANRGEGDQWWSFIHKIPYGDKLGHIGLCGTLSFLCNLAFPSRKFGRFVSLTTLVLLTIISLEELSQLFIPTRSFDLFDWLADLIGLAAGQTAATILMPRPSSPLKVEP